MIYTKQEEYRSTPLSKIEKNNKSLVLSFTVWGDQYIRLFTDYCIPSMISKGNSGSATGVPIKQDS